MNQQSVFSMNTIYQCIDTDTTREETRIVAQAEFNTHTVNGRQDKGTHICSSRTNNRRNQQSVSGMWIHNKEAHNCLLNFLLSVVAMCAVYRLTLSWSKLNLSCNVHESLTQTLSLTLAFSATIIILCLSLLYLLEYLSVVISHTFCLLPTLCHPIFSYSLSSNSFLLSVIQ